MNFITNMTLSVKNKLKKNYRQVAFMMLYLYRENNHLKILYYNSNNV